MEENQVPVEINLEQKLQNQESLGVNFAQEVPNQEAQLPAKVGFWNKFKSMFLIDLTPREQKVEDDINEFLHQEVTWKGIKSILFQEIRF